MALRRILLDGTLEPMATAGFRYIGSTAPSTSGWKTGELWLDTTLLSTSVAATIRYWDGTQFMPTPSGGSGLPGTVIFNYDFAGADNAVWSASKWGQGRDPSSGTGGKATLLSNTGVLQTSTTGAYAGAASIARKATMTDAADVNVVMQFKFDATETFLDLNVRHDVDSVDGKNCYSFRVASTGGWTVTKQTNYVSSSIGTAQTFTFAANTWYKARFYVVGTAIKARVWLASASEPGSYPVDTTDATYSAAGKLGFCLRNGNAAVSSRVFLDNVVVTST